MRSCMRLVGESQGGGGRCCGGEPAGRAGRRGGPDLNDVRTAVLRGKERQEAASTLIAEWVIKTDDAGDDEEKGRY
jgi:hypothetical protein